MELLSEDDLNLKDMTPEELDRAWDLWFDLAQANQRLRSALDARGLRSLRGAGVSRFYGTRGLA